jgi:hypothetical protein
LTAPFEFYSRWRTIGAEEPIGDEERQLKV